MPTTPCRPTLARLARSVIMSSGFGGGRCGAAARSTRRPGSGWARWPTTGSHNRASFTLGRAFALPSNTRGRSRMRETRSSGSVRGASGDGCPYRELAGLLRQSVFGRLAGYEDVNDAERLCRDPAMRWVVGGRAITGSAASASQMGRFDTKWLSRPENLVALADLPGQWIDGVHQRRPPRIIVLDMDSSESPTYGEQEGSAYNGHFGCTCYHPQFVFNQLGDVERCALRSGNVHSADGWRAVLEPVVARYRDTVKRLYFR